MLALDKAPFRMPTAMLGANSLRFTTLASRKSILVVADDTDLRPTLVQVLGRSGYVTHEADKPETALATLGHREIDLILVDLASSMDTAMLLRQVREVSSTPMVLLGRDEEREELRALSLGADDYVAKPFSLARLLARVDVHLRRSAIRGESAPMRTEDAVIRIDHARRQAYVRGTPVHLSPTEYRLLVVLFQNPRQVVAHKQLLLEVWGPGYDSVDYLKAYVRYLRLKIERNPDEPELIHTCWGVGYRYENVEDVEASPRVA